MDIEFSEEQEMLKTTTRDFLSAKFPVSSVRKMIQAEDDNDYPSGLWDQISDLGWLGLAFPSRYGGEAFSFSDLVVLLEEMGRVCFPSPFFSTVILGGLSILHLGNEEQKNEFLPDLCRGKLFITMAITEADSSFQSSSITLKAVADKNDFILSGTKLFVPDAHIADWIICVARTSKSENPEDGVTVFLINAQSDGIEYNPLKTLDGSKQSEVIFNKVRVPGKNALGEVDKGWRSLQKVLEYAAVAKCAEMLGAVQVITEMTVQYAKDRKQFGQPISAFQVIQHLCADMLTDVDTMRLITHKAGWMLNEGMPCSNEVSIAKAWSSDAYKRVALNGLKIHGGMGFMEEHDISLFYKKAQINEFSFGDAAFHEEVIAEQLGI